MEMEEKALDTVETIEPEAQNLESEMETVTQPMAEEERDLGDITLDD